MIEQATIVKVKKNFAFVEIKKSAKCEGCKICMFGEHNTIVIPAIMEKQVTAGERVVLMMPESSPAGASLVLFLFPLLLMLVGFLAGFSLGVWQMLLFGFLALGTGFVISAVFDRRLRRNPKYMPVIVDKIL